MDESTRQPHGIGWWCRRVFVVIVLMSCLVGGAMAYIGISESLQAEETLHATLFAIRLVEQCVVEKQRWPRSWDELESLRFGGEQGYEWPAVSTDIQKRVFIDFAVDPMAVAEQAPMNFTAIKPIGPYYEFHHSWVVQSLQEEILRAARKAESQ